MKTIFINPLATHLLIRTSEIALKGRNRIDFEVRLFRNMRHSMGPGLSIVHFSNRVLIDLKNVTVEKQKELIQSLSFTAGILGIAPCVVISDYTLDSVTAQAQAWMAHAPELKTAKTFAIRTRRIKKSFPLTSTEFDHKIAALMNQLQPSLTTNIKQADFRLSIELREKHTIIYSFEADGLHGLPQDPNERVISLLSGGIDSPVAAIDILRRGCSLELLHFHSQPFTSEASVLKIKKLAQIIKQYSTNPMALYLVPLLDIQQTVCARCREEYRTIHYRRFMMRVAEELARRTNSKAIVTGEAISQVASQTLTNLGAIEDVIRLPILRPLIGCDKEAIIAKARTLGTYETSIEPHDDSCSLFASKHPSTRASLEKLNLDDQGLEIDKLVLSALDSMEKVIIK